MGVENMSELHVRLVEAVGDLTYRRLGQLTDTHPETVRRYMHGQSPSTEFLAKLCRALSVNANWLLTGQGPRRTEDIRVQTLRSATPSELLSALSESATNSRDRITQLERRLSRLEALLGTLGPEGVPRSGGPDLEAGRTRLTRPGVPDGGVGARDRAGENGGRA